MLALYIILGIIVLILIFIAANYNGLVRLRNHLAMSTRDGVPEFSVSANDLARKDELGEIARAVDELNSRVVSRSFFDEVLQSMSDLLIVTNARHEIILVNRALLQAMNRCETDVLGKPFSILLPDHGCKRDTVRIAGQWIHAGVVATNPLNRGQVGYGIGINIHQAAIQQPVPFNHAEVSVFMLPDTVLLAFPTLVDLGSAIRPPAGELGILVLTLYQ